MLEKVVSKTQTRNLIQFKSNMTYIPKGGYPRPDPFKSLYVNTSLYYLPVATIVFLDIYTYEVYLKTDLMQYSGIKAYKLNYLVETRNEFVHHLWKTSLSEVSNVH